MTTEIAEPKPFTAARAFAMFVLLFAGQMLAAIVAVIVAFAVGVARGADLGDANAVRGLMTGLELPIFAASAIGSAIALVLGARLLAWDLVRKPAADGIGTLTAPKRAVILWSLLGFATAVIYIVVATKLLPPDPSTPLGPLARTAAQGGIARVFWAILGILFAPPVEEFLFRGLMFRGFTNSWGPRVAGVLVTVLFVAMHLVETWRYWPATVAILSLALVALAARIRTGSLIAPIAVHVAYNAGIVISAYSLT
ncbi:MAG TPA: type II CAAX endopeptidase family protein [Thermoanaerobaculia bacterium]|jgi:membrane protease YdiL (CAAX protease family)